MFNKNLVKFLVIASTVAGIPALAAPSNEGGVSKTQVNVGSQCMAGKCMSGKGHAGKGDAWRYDYLLS